MKSINLFLTSRQMSPEKKLRLNENISGKSLLDLPPEILANILKQTYDFPMLFNLCRINHKFNEFIHSHFKNIGVVEVRKYLDMDKSVHTPRTRSLPRSRTFREIMHQIVIVRCHTLSGIISYDKFSLALFGQLLSVLKMCVHMESFEVLHAMVWCSGREAYQFNKLFTIGFTHLKHLKLNWHTYTNRKLELSGCTMLKSLNWCGNSIGLKVISVPTWIKDLTLVDLTVDSFYILHNLLVPVAMDLEQLSLINIHVFGSTRNSNHDTHHGQLVYLKLPKLKQLHLSSAYYGSTEVKIMLDLCDSGNIERIEVALRRSQCFEIINFNLSNCPNLVTFDYDDGGDNPLQLELPSFPTRWNNLKELTGCAQSNFDLVLEIVNNSPRLEFVNLNGSCDVTVYGLATLVAAVYHNYNGQFKFVKIQCKLPNQLNGSNCCRIEFCQHLLQLLSSCTTNLKSLSFTIESGDWCESTCAFDAVEFDSLVSQFKENYAIQIVFSSVRIDGFKVSVCTVSERARKPRKSQIPQKIEC